MGGGQLPSVEQMRVVGSHRFRALHWGAREQLPQPFADEAVAF